MQKCKELSVTDRMHKVYLQWPWFWLVTSIHYLKTLQLSSGTYILYLLLPASTITRIYCHLHLLSPASTVTCIYCHLQLTFLSCSWGGTVCQEMLSCAIWFKVSPTNKNSQTRLTFYWPSKMTRTALAKETQTMLSKNNGQNFIDKRKKT